MVVVIQEIKKEPIAEAEVLIRENISDCPVPTTQASGSLERFSPLPETERTRQTGAVALRKKERDTLAMFHDYGDGIRETYEVDSLLFFALLPRTTQPYQPMVMNLFLPSICLT